MKNVASIALVTALVACVPFQRGESVTVEVALDLDGTCGGELPTSTDDRGTVTGHSEPVAEGCRVFVHWEGLLLDSEALAAAVEATVEEGGFSANNLGKVQFVELEAEFLRADLVVDGESVPFPAPIDVVGRVELDASGWGALDPALEGVVADPVIEVAAEDVTVGFDGEGGVASLHLGPVKKAALEPALHGLTLSYQAGEPLLGTADVELLIAAEDLPRFEGYLSTLALDFTLDLDGKARVRL